MTGGSLFNLHFVVVAIITGIAFYILIFQKNLIKVIMALGLMASAANLFIISLGYRTGGVVPIWTNLRQELVVLPVPQALTLTSIVIAVATMAMMVSLVIRIYRNTGSTDTEKSRQMKG